MDLPYDLGVLTGLSVVRSYTFSRPRAASDSARLKQQQRAHLEPSETDARLERRRLARGLLHARALLRARAVIIEHSAELDVEDVRLRERVRKVLEHKGLYTRALASAFSPLAPARVRSTQRSK